MAWRLVDEREVVAVVLHLWTPDHRVSQLREDAAHLPRRDGHRVEASTAQRWRRTGQVEWRVVIFTGGLELRAASVDRLRDPSDQLVDRLPQLPSGLDIAYGADTAPQRTERAVSTAQVTLAQALELG